MSRNPAAWGRLVGLVALVSATVAACNVLPLRQPEPTLPVQVATPTRAIAQTPMPSAPTPSPTPTLAPTLTPHAGILDARFVRDVTIPDGHIVRPGEPFIKIWELRNAGEVAWPVGTVLQHVGGPGFGPVESVSLRPREPGETAQIAVDMIAPTEPGLHTSYWQICVDQHCFGSRIWVQVRVRP